MPPGRRTVRVVPIAAIALPVGRGQARVVPGLPFAYMGGEALGEAEFAQLSNARRDAGFDVEKNAALEPSWVESNEALVGDRAVLESRALDWLRAES